MKIIGIIPARGGSKSIPGKNIKKIGGKPLIAWSILSALKSSLDRVIVSTDEPKIARIAKKYGAEVPFIRPAKLAGDTVGMEPVLLHTLEWLKKNEGYVPDAVALLQSTCPLRKTKHINEAIEIFKKKSPDSIVSAHEAMANNNPGWILKKDARGNVTLFNGEPLTEMKTRRQELPVCYSRNDIIYLLRPKNLYEKIPNLYGKKVELYVMDNKWDLDINTPDDWLDAEIKFHKLT